eukprot:766736-Hanusia_phi.AAC.1
MNTTEARQWKETGREFEESSREIVVLEAVVVQKSNVARKGKNRLHPLHSQHFAVLVCLQCKGQSSVSPPRCSSQSTSPLPLFSPHPSPRILPSSPPLLSSVSSSPPPSCPSSPLHATCLLHQLLPLLGSSNHGPPSVAVGSRLVHHAAPEVGGGQEAKGKEKAMVETKRGRELKAAQRVTGSKFVIMLEDVEQHKKQGLGGRLVKMRTNMTKKGEGRRNGGRREERKKKEEGEEENGKGKEVKWRRRGRKEEEGEGKEEQRSERT